jgi:hypothetical protein
MQIKNKNMHLALGGLLVLVWMMWPSAEVTDATAQETKPSAAKRGEYLTTIMGCHDCHTPKNQGPHGEPLPNMKLQLSGHPADLPYPIWTPADLQERHALALMNPMLTAFAGPWGVSFASNLTPDKATGLGEWTEEVFIQALRTGQHQGQPNGRPPHYTQNS